MVFEVSFGDPGPRVRSVSPGRFPRISIPVHPAWYLNLQAHPEVEVQIGSEKPTMRAETATPEKKQKLWPRACPLYPPYEGYQKKTDREMPVVILRPL